MMSGIDADRKGLLDELKRLAAVRKTDEFNFAVDIEKLPGEERELARLFAQILRHCKAAAEYDLIKYKLTNDALGIAHWDMDVVHGDPINPNNRFTWSQELRHMLGFSGESDFPDILSSWSNRLHPEDKDRVLTAFAAHLTDVTGKTPYDLEYRLMTKSGEYRYLHAIGLTMRDEAGRPLKAAGALEDMTTWVQQQEMLESILNTMDSYIYISDLETDEMLFANHKMITDFKLRGSVRGDKCWQHLQFGQTGRCSWCKKDELLHNPDAPVAWEEDNPISGNSLHKIDRIINWSSGRKVHMQQAIDITEIKQAQKAIVQREKMLEALNRAAIIILSRKDEMFEDAMTEGISLISGIANFDRMSVFRNSEKPDGLHLSQIYRWTREADRATGTLEISYAEIFPRWQGILAAGKCINDPVRLMPEAEALQQFGCVTVLAVPVLSDGAFWGFALFENLREEKCFTVHETDMLRSASFMLVNAVIRNEEAKKIREADEYAKLLLDATPLASRLWDKNYNLIECNEAAVKLFQLKDKREYLERYFELSPEYQPDGQSTPGKVRAMIREAFAKGACTYDWTYNLLDGTSIPSEVTMVRIPYGDDYVVASYSRDLREQQKMIAEIEQRDRLLQTVNLAADILFRSEPEDFAATLHHCMGMMAHAIDADRMRVMKNQVENGSLYRIQLYEWSDNVWPIRDTPMAAHVAYAEKMPEMHEVLLRGECVHSLVRDMPSADRAWFGGQGILAVLLVPIFIRDEFWGVVGFDNCRSERTFTENEESVMHSGSLLIVNALLRNEFLLSIQDTSTQLKAALADAKEANSAKSSFLAHMSHEIRTPLNAVVGLSELALDDDGLKAGMEDKLEKIHAAGMTILSIVNDILDISKIESGKFEIYPARYDTPSLINDIVTLNSVRIGEKPITFQIFVDKNLPGALYGDDLRVKQIFNNLLSNAFKYTNSGTVEWRMSYERDKDSVWLVSTVRDTGIGMKPEGVRKLFTDYNQVDVRTNRKVEGTGLGLAITKRLVEMMDGTIAVESEYGKGTTFCVRLRQDFVAGAPIGKAVADNLMDLRYMLSKRDKNTKSARVNLSYAHVLVVDDIVTNFDVVKGMLKPYKMKIDCVTSGRQAVDLIRAGSPRYNAVFMDHMMPEMDGIETMWIIREEIGTDYARNVPVIALTANAIVGNEEMFLRLGFQDFLSKPIDTVKLDAVLRRWVRDRELEKKLPNAGEDIYLADNEYPGAEKESSLLDGVSIDGVNQERALERFRGSESVFIDVLRSYAVNTRPLLSSLAEFLTAENLEDYAIVVHGIKGSSYGIFAQETGKMAEMLEMAAKAGDLGTVQAGHAVFREIAETLLHNMDKALAAIDASANKPVAAAPDPELLKELREACNAFNMDRVDKTMEKLLSFRYESGEDLVAWLREQVGNMAFEKISGGECPFALRSYFV